MTAPIKTYAELPSTNAEGLRLLLQGETAPFWVTAARQTAGRGRSGRAWVSEPGNLYASLCVRLDCAPGVLHQLSFVAAVATVQALKQIAPGLAFKLKWPNDILLGDAKLTGILCESTLQAAATFAVLGIGINLAHAPGDLGRATTSLDAHGFSVSPARMLDALSAELADALRLWADGVGFAEVRARWLADSLPLGTAMSVNTADGVLQGSFTGLDASGALILTDASGTQRALSFGDVTLTGRTGG